MENNEVKENKMGVMPVGKLLLNMSLPMMFSMLVMALYNIIDSIFVSQINEEALTAVSLAFPFQSLVISVSGGTNVGMNALLSMRLGQKNQEGVNKAAGNGIFLAFISYLAFILICVLFVSPYLKSQTQNETIISYATTYLFIIMICGIGPFMGMTFDRLLQSTGKTFYTMITQLIGSVFNIVFDPLLIFGIGPFPEMGIAGAALATVLGQIFGWAFSIYFNLKKNTEIEFNKKYLKPDLKIIGQIYKVGLPSIVLQAVGSVTTYGMNLILASFKGIADTAIAVYGAYFKLNSFLFMPVFGMNQGIVPIVAYNYGARNHKRITNTLRAGLAGALTIMCFGILIFELFPAQLYGLFNASEQMLAIGIPALRIIAPSFFGAAICITLGCIFQAMGSASYSMFVSLARQLLFLLPSAYFLSKTGNINNVWFCFLIAEVISLTLSLLFYKRLYEKKIRNL